MAGRTFDGSGAMSAEQLELTELVAVAHDLAARGFAAELEQAMFQACLGHEEDWRTEFGDDDPDVLWLEAMKRKHAATDAGPAD